MQLHLKIRQRVEWRVGRDHHLSGILQDVYVRKNTWKGLFFLEAKVLMDDGRYAYPAYWDLKGV